MDGYKETIHDLPSLAREHRRFDAGYSSLAVRDKKQQSTFKYYPFVVEWQLNNTDPESKSDA